MSLRRFNSNIKVHLSCTGERIDKSDIQIIDHESLMNMQDTVTFVCPICGETHKSRLF